MLKSAGDSIRAMNSKKASPLFNAKGSILLETVIAMLIMVAVGTALIALIQKATIVSFKARENMTCSRMAQTSFVRIKNIDFYKLFAADSAQANHGLWAAYPYKAVLDGVKTTLAASKFDRFRVTVKFMRRDTSDVNGNGLTSDLIEFSDANGDNMDDYDSNIRYQDQNADGDYYDTFLSGGRTVAEQPDTHIKQVTVDIYRGNRVACSQTDLVSLEQFSGDPNPSSEAVLSLLISTPVNSAFLYDLSTVARQNSRALAISKSYPADIYQYRTDSASPLPISGETDPLSTVRFYVGVSGELANAAADAFGNFSASPLAVTLALSEGSNQLRAQATKDTYTSPVALRTLLLDKNPPTLNSMTPSGTVGTASPYVSAVMTDTGISTTVTSGICADVISMKVNGQDVYYDYNASSGTVVWIDSATMTVPVLPDGVYSVTVEGGDYAGYKVSSSWAFAVSRAATDNSAPSIAQKSPIGMAGSDLPEISVKVFDNQSGIIPSSIVLKLDGAVVVNSANISSNYDPGSDKVSYIPPAAFDPASPHTVEITASHWATDPADKITSTDSWSFIVP